MSTTPAAATKAAAHRGEGRTPPAQSSRTRGSPAIRVPCPVLRLRRAPRRKVLGQSLGQPFTELIGAVAIEVNAIVPAVFADHARRDPNVLDRKSLVHLHHRATERFIRFRILGEARD